MRDIQRNISFGLPLIFFFIYTLWWIYLQFFQSNTTSQNDIFSITYGLIALWGCWFGYCISRSWGGFRTILGKALLLFSLGLALQEVGQLIYTYYIYYLGIEVPYPSWGDIGYFGSIPFYIGGVWLLGQAAGVKFSFKSVGHKIQGIVIPLCILILSYVVFLQGYEFDWSQPLTIFLDFGYPFGQAIYISLGLLTYLLSRNLLGGVMKYRILIVLLALLIQYLADFTFLYQASNDTWVAGGINDYMYLMAYLAMTVGLLQFNIKSIKSKLDTKNK